jgi:hypothetical protein
MLYLSSLLDRPNQLNMLMMVDLTSALPGAHEPKLELTQRKQPEDREHDIQHECNRENEYENRFIE